MGYPMTQYSPWEVSLGSHGVPCWPTAHDISWLLQVVYTNRLGRREPSKDVQVKVKVSLFGPTFFARTGSSIGLKSYPISLGHRLGFAILYAVYLWRVFTDFDLGVIPR